MARPSKYKAEYLEQARKLALLGATDIEMADFFGVCEKTFNNWKHEKEGFLQSIKSGKVLADADVADSLYNRALGYDKDDKHYPADTTAQIFWLCNRQRKMWSRNPVVEEGADDATPVSVSFNVVDASVKPDE